MASGPDSTQVPLPEDDNDFDLFGPADTAGAGGTGPATSCCTCGAASDRGTRPCYAANDVANDAESADYAGNAEQAHGR